MTKTIIMKENPRTKIKRAISKQNRRFASLSVLRDERKSIGGLGSDNHKQNIKILKQTIKIYDEIKELDILIDELSRQPYPCPKCDRILVYIKPEISTVHSHGDKEGYFWCECGNRKEVSRYN